MATSNQQGERVTDDRTTPFQSGHFKIISFDRRTTEQLIPFNRAFSDTTTQLTYTIQADAEQEAARLAAHAPSYLTFTVVQIQQVATFPGTQPAGRQSSDPSQDVLKRLEGLPWG
jgi:hypothetical protein